MTSQPSSGRFKNEGGTSSLLSTMEHPPVSVTGSFPRPQQDVAGHRVTLPLGLRQLPTPMDADAPMPPSVFSTTTVTVDIPPPSSPPSIPGNLTTYSEVVNKLNRLFDEQSSTIEKLTDDHWKSQEFPLARIKKIMRMDDEVKMISAEVPIMFSKAIEMFITELALRGWLHTEDAKRRTVQRSDIAMAITKHDMFDFLIDIVPREEIQVKNKVGSKAEVEGMPLLSPELLQVYLQQLAQQHGGESGEGEEEEGEQGSASMNTTGLLQQQLQLLQQILHIQQLQQAQELEQQQSSTTPLQHPPQDTPGVATTILDQSHVHSSTVVQSQPPLIRSQVTPSLSGAQQTVVSLSGGGQHTLRHAPHDVILETQPQSAPVVMHQSLLETQGQQQPTLLGTQGQYQLRHLDHNQDGLSVVQQVLVTNQIQNVSFGRTPVQNIGVEEEEVEFQHIPESESISRSISPIAATLQSATQVGTYPSHRTPTSLPGEARLSSLQQLASRTATSEANINHSLQNLANSMSSS